MTNDPPFEAVAYQMHLFSVRGWNAAMEAAEAGESVGSTVRVTLNDDRFQKHRIPLVGMFGKESDDGKMMNMLNQKIFFLVRRLVYFITILQYVYAFIFVYIHIYRKTTLFLFSNYLAPTLCTFFRKGSIGISLGLPPLLQALDDLHWLLALYIYTLRI